MLSDSAADWKLALALLQHRGNPLQAISWVSAERKAGRGGCGGREKGREGKGRRRRTGEEIEQGRTANLGSGRGRKWEVGG